MHLSNCNVAPTEEPGSGVSFLKYKWRKVSATRGFPQGCGRNAPRFKLQPVDVVVSANGEPLGSVIAEKGDLPEVCGLNAPLVNAGSSENGVSCGLIEYSKVETVGARVEPSSIEQSGSPVDLEVTKNSGQNESSQLLKPLTTEFPQNCGRSAPRINAKLKKVGVVSANRRFPRGCGRNAPPLEAKSNDDSVSVSSVENTKVDTDGAFLYSVECSGISPEFGSFKVIEGLGQTEPPNLPKALMSETTTFAQDFNQVEAPKRTKVPDPMVDDTPKSLVMVEPTRTQNGAQVNPTPIKGGVVSTNKKFHEDVSVENLKVEIDVPLAEPPFNHSGSSVDLGAFEMTEDQIVSPRLPKALILGTTNAPEVMVQTEASKSKKALEPLLDTMKFSEMIDLLSPTEKAKLETTALLKNSTPRELFDSVKDSDGPEFKDLLECAVQPELPSSLVQLPVDSVLPETFVQLKVSGEPQTSDSGEALEHNMHKKYPPRRRTSASRDFPQRCTINPPRSILQVSSFIDPPNVGSKKGSGQTAGEQIVVDDAKQKMEKIDDEDAFQSRMQGNNGVTEEIGDQAQVKLLAAVAKEMVDADVREASQMQEYVGLEPSNESLIDQALVAAPNCPWNLRKHITKSENGLSHVRVKENKEKKLVAESCTVTQSHMQAYVGLKMSKKRVIIQALMAAPNCPWNLVRQISKSPSGLSHVTSESKGKEHDVVVQDDSKFIFAREKANLGTSELNYRNDDSEADVNFSEVGESMQLVQTSHDMDLSSIQVVCHPLGDKESENKNKHEDGSCTLNQSLMEECAELGIPKKRVIVQALMAAPNCPWNMAIQTSQFPSSISNATSERKGKKHEFVVQDDSKYITGRKKAKVVKSEVKNGNKKIPPTRNVSDEGAGQVALVDEDDYVIHDKEDGSSLLQTSGDNDLSLTPFGLHPSIDKNCNNEADVTCKEVGEKDCLIDQALVAALKCPWNLRKRTVKYQHGVSRAGVKESKEKKHVGGIFAVTQSQMQEYVGLEISKQRVIVQALMAAPNCPWNMARPTSISPSGLSNASAKRKGKAHEFVVQYDKSFSVRKKARVIKSEVEYRKEKISSKCARQLTLMDGDDDSIHDKEDDSYSVQASRNVDLGLVPFGLHPFIDKNAAGITCNEVGESSHSLNLSLVSFGCDPLADKDNDNEAGVTRNRVRETLRLFQGVVRKILQDVESKSKDVQANGSVRADLLSAKILKERNKWVNTGKPILGAVPGVEIGDEFHYRAELAIVGLHRLFQSGIDYLKRNGIPITTSVVASGGYNDVMDGSDVLVYSGQGGNPTDRSKNAEDQKLEKGNLSLKNSINEQSPVRVIRGFKETKGNGKVVATYTYDGLYLVESYWEELGTYGTKVFKFQLKRIPGQPELAIKEVKKSKKSKAREGLCVYDISLGKEKIPISAINTVDDETPPSFEYITKMMYPLWYNLTLPDGCLCTDGCSDSENCSCAKKNGGEIPFNYDGAIVEAKALVYACGPSCKCPPSCHNRVGQRGVTFQLEIFKTESRGWGVRSMNSISSGSFVCEYTGELLRDDEAERRTSNDEYLFDIGYNYNDHALWEGLSNIPLDSNSSSSCESLEDEGFTIDAAQYGNVGRFINHSCSPNIYAQNVLYDHDDKRMPHIMFFASENIPPLQELTYHYNYELDQVRDSDGNIKKKNCYCGSPECTGRMY